MISENSEGKYEHIFIIVRIAVEALNSREPMNAVAIHDVVKEQREAEACAHRITPVADEVYVPILGRLERSLRETSGPGFAIIRIDGVTSGKWLSENDVTIQKVVRTVDRAEAEVSRLNQLNRTKGSTYFWKAIRLPASDE